MDAVKAPEGVEYSVVAYLTSDNTGLEARITISASKTLPIVQEDCCHHLGQSRELRTVASDWRAMTREEISDYKRRERDD